MKRKVLVAVAASLLATTWLASGAPAAGAQTTTRDPVVIVGGTFAGDGVADVYYSLLAQRLRNDGYQVEVFALSAFGLADARDSARRLNTVVDSVRARTGAAKVDLVAHSQGGMVSRWYIKNLGGSAEVDSLVNLGAVNYGTSVANLVKLLGIGSCLGVVACQQMSIGSSFLNELNAGPDTDGSVRYTNIVTALDVVIVPYTNGYLRDGTNYVNVSVQSQCWARVVGHLTLATDGTVYSGIQDALAKRPISFNCFAV